MGTLVRLFCSSLIIGAPVILRYSALLSLQSPRAALYLLPSDFQHRRGCRESLAPLRRGFFESSSQLISSIVFHVRL